MPEYPSKSEGDETPDLPLLRKSRAYARAFEDYIRHGEPIRIDEVKARSLRESEGPSATQYIWRTQGDGKVRASHRANDGKIFSLNAIV